MNNSETRNLSKDKVYTLRFSHIIPAVFSCFALLATFSAANSNLGFQTKVVVFLFIMVSYLLGSAALYGLERRRLDDSSASADAEISEGVFSREVENRLLALEEASEYFGASLKSADMFRFVSSRVKEIIPFAGSALFLADETGKLLRTAFADGENAESLANLELNSYQGLAGKAFTSRQLQIEEKLSLDKNVLSAEALKNLNSAVAVPLRRGAAVFAVLNLYGKEAGSFSRDSLQLLEAVGTRIAPLFLSSFAFEKSLSNALTDSLTNLPNERAFYLVVENQIAEAQRFRELRPLTILTVDVKNFAELNEKFGHAAGDRILAFAAQTIKAQLRQMDFLARATGDEFFAVLPTADERIAEEIVERVEKTFVSNPFAVSRLEKIHLALNFGAATFWKDGETVSQLLQNARLRKTQSKSIETGKVLWFPKEFVN